MDTGTSMVMWYIVLLLIGIIFVPLTRRLFPLFIDGGYAFAKTVGLLCAVYGSMVLGILHILRFEQIWLIIGLAIVAFFMYRKTSIADLKRFFLRPNKTLFFILGQELLFLVAFWFYATVRGQQPIIEGLEKFMDLGFINSILRSTYFPPVDMWLSGANPDPYTGKNVASFAINYYYFGHLTGALITKLSGVPSEIGYNLVLTTIFAQSAAMCFGFAANLVYIVQRYVLRFLQPKFLPMIITGLIAAFITNLGGNLHTIYFFTTGYPNDNPEPFWTIFSTIGDIVTKANTDKVNMIEALINNSHYWYPNATRFIPHTIHEFPSYSYVVADVHGHVYDILYVIFSLAMIVMFVLTVAFKIKPDAELAANRKDQHNPTYEWPELFALKLGEFVSPKKMFAAARAIAKEERSIIFYPLVFGFMAGVHYMTNAFDGPIYLLMFSITFLMVYGLSLRLVIAEALLVVGFIVFSFPFSAFFIPFVSGSGVNCAYPLAEGINNFVHIFKLALDPAGKEIVGTLKLGPLLFEKGNCQVSPLYMLFVLWGFFWFCCALLVVTLRFMKQAQNQIRDTKKKRAIYDLNAVDVCMLLFFGFGTLLLVIPEFVYVKDIYPTHFRANTMFKLGYQAYIMMSIASAYVWFRIARSEIKQKWALLAIYIVLVIMVMLYPFAAFKSYYPNLDKLSTYFTVPDLDGSKWFANEKDMAQDKDIIEYLNKNIVGQPVVLEAQGDSYTKYERISTYTGLPTIAGWWVHEWLWRGSADVVGKRIVDIEKIYQSEDEGETRDLLNKYSVDYVVISGKEREKYPKLNEDKFKKMFGEPIFKSTKGDTGGGVYKVNRG